MATKNDKTYKEYFAFDIIDEGDGPYICDHQITDNLKEAQEYSYIVAIELPAGTRKASKLLASVKV